MKIYTRKGDRGETSLFGGKRVLKDSLRIESYGCVDELNSVLGVARSSKPPSDVDSILDFIQNDLFVLGADLATPLAAKVKKVQRIEPSHVEKLESTIDRLETSLQPLDSFILPGGSNIGAQLHVARTICRRAERITIRLSKKEKIGETPVMYLNRLSDCLFVLARYMNNVAGAEEKKWKPET
ncbi:MAG: cob(I)yrinic acid a,c-diamide adenosyltransferase [Ignavibacteriales bacterium]|nr:cob(I)yrinic acid a,c-diamide adenosyltransferase [Ignavibacteriales bacterium]